MVTHGTNAQGGILSLLFSCAKLDHEHGGIRSLLFGWTVLRLNLCTVHQISVRFVVKSCSTLSQQYGSETSKQTMSWWYNQNGWHILWDLLHIPWNEGKGEVPNSLISARYAIYKDFYASAKERWEKWVKLLLNEFTPEVPRDFIGHLARWLINENVPVPTSPVGVLKHLQK